TRNLVEAGDLVGEFGGCKIALLPELSEAGEAVLAFGPSRMGSARIHMTVSGTEIGGKAFGVCSISTHDTPRRSLDAVISARLALRRQESKRGSERPRSLPKSSIRLL